VGGGDAHDAALTRVLTMAGKTAEMADLMHGVFIPSAKR
jgi:hypothetical protein